MSVYSGNAFNKGVAFHNNDQISIAYRDKNGRINIKTEKNILVKHKRKIKKIPFIRGIVVLLESFSTAWKVNSKLLLIVIPLVILLEFGGEYLGIFDLGEVASGAEKYFMLLVLAAGFIMSRTSRVARYHGAEHKVFNASKAGTALTIENVRLQKRYAEECGTNLLVFILIIFTILELIGIAFLLCFLIASSVGYELFLIKRKSLKNMLLPFYLIGYVFQYFIFTAEPSEKELEVALAAYRGMCINN